MFYAFDLFYRCAKIACLLKTGAAFDFAGFKETAGKNAAQIFPAKMICQMTVVKRNIVKSVPLGGHEQST